MRFAHFSNEFIEKVREANDLVEIIGQHTELKGNGHRLMGRCPFPDHNDKSPSFSVSSDSQLYYCYGCKKGGNVFTFLETFNGMSFPEAVEFLARRASIPLPERTDPKEVARSGQAREKKDLLLRVNKLAAIYYHQNYKALAEDHPARVYARSRGLNDEIVEKFRIGLSPAEWQGLTKYFKAKRVPMELAESLGLLKPKRNAKADDSHFDIFRDRLMFPIFSATGDVIGFGGRTLDPDGIPKYLNSSDSPVFNKSRVLYGIHETGKYIRAADQAIVVEGYMDAIALYGAGIQNVVAILGTAFTPEHAKFLKRYTHNVVMLLDGDEAGLNGAERSLPILLEAGLMPKGFALPDKMDPDDFIKSQGVEKLKDEIARAPELFTLLLTRRWMNDYHGTPSEKVRIVEEAAIALSRAGNRQLLELYILELSRQLDVEVGWVRRALATASSGTRPQPVPKAGVQETENVPKAPIDSSPDRIRLKGAPKDEIFVMSLLLHHEELMRQLIEAGPDEVFEILSFDGVRLLIRMAIERYLSRPEEFKELAASLVTHVDDPALLSVVLGTPAAPGEENSGEVAKRLMADYLNAIRLKALKKKGKALLNQLKEHPSPEALEQFMNIQRHRLGLARDTET